MKRFFDTLFSIILLLPALLFIGILSVLIVVIDRFSPFFKQKRIGKNNKMFICYKLQALKPTKKESEIDDKKKDLQRLTKLGVLLRDHGWDELPQIINILFGQMSFIGPRPLLSKSFDQIKTDNPKFIEMIEVWEKRRAKVPPGLSGWYQIHPVINSLGIVKYDLDYFDKPSGLRNIKIFIISIIIFIFGKKIVFGIDSSI